MKPIVKVRDLNKVYRGGHQALTDINLDIYPGEILALLGPNGAGKTTLISIICGIANPTSGSVTVDGKDIRRDYRYTRSMIGLVPQELTTDAFETPWVTVNFSRGLFGKPSDPEYVEQVLRNVSLWDKRFDRIMTLSGGMKRRLLIAKALSHQPRVLFLDEPTAGVDVELRREMWQLVHRLRESGVTIILTTHYIEEAEAMADRIGIINQGRIMLTERKEDLMQKLGRKRLILDLAEPLQALPALAQGHDDATLSADGLTLTFTFEQQGGHNNVAALFDEVRAAGVQIHDLRTEQSSLEDIFVGLLEDGK